MKKMNKSLADFNQHKGWSANLFQTHANYILPQLELLNIEYQLGRTVLHLKYNGEVWKIYPHFKGQSNEYLTIIKDNIIIDSFHFNITSEELLKKIEKIIKNFD